MVRVAGLGSRAGKRSRHWGKVGAGPKRDLTLSAFSKDILTAIPGFLPTSSMLGFTPRLYKLFLDQSGYDFLMMAMSAFKGCTA